MGAQDAFALVTRPSSDLLRREIVGLDEQLDAREVKTFEPPRGQQSNCACRVATTATQCRQPVVDLAAAVRPVEVADADLAERLRALSLAGYECRSADELVETYGVQAFGAQAVEDERQRADEHGAVGERVPVEPVVKHDDRAGSDVAQDAARDGARALHGPIAGGVLPHDESHAVIVDDMRDERGPVTVWGSIERGARRR